MGIMSALILELKQGESMIVNGAVIRFKTRTRIELSTQARFLFGKQIMPAEEATTPVKKIYFELQHAYIGAEEARPEALQRARSLIRDHGLRADAATQASVVELLAIIADGAGFEALKRARQMIRDEVAPLS